MEENNNNNNNESLNSNFSYASSNNENTFKASKHQPKNSGIGKSVVVPFVSGVVGATLVVGTCFGVPSIKNSIMGTSSNNSSSKIQSSTSTDSTQVNISDYSNTAVSVAEKVLPSIVGITVKYNVSSFFGSSEAEATGSGIIISEDGYILTNNHVISSESSSSYYQVSEATSITINLYNDTETYDATVIGTDEYTDLAVLKIDKTGLTAATLGNSDNVKVGEFVMALGNPLGMEYSVTCGIVSAVNREVESDNTTYEAIQTDAAINSGNSGGALVNAQGEVIGINTLKLSGSGIEGIGFAIPISSTTNVINQLIEYQTVKRPYIGVSAEAVDENASAKYGVPEGVYVDKVEKDSPAEKAGIQKGDIITKIEGTEVSSVNDLNKVKYTYNIGDTITLTIYRDKQEQDVQVTLVETPETDTSTNSDNKQNNGQSQYYYYNSDDSDQNNSDINSFFDLFR